jgi:hypothetical protein
LQQINGARLPAQTWAAVPKQDMRGNKEQELVLPSMQAKIYTLPVRTQLVPNLGFNLRGGIMD